jgi:hypothetical protein
MSALAPGASAGLSAQGWNPKKLPGLKSWLRSDLGIALASGKVSAWSDLSTNGVGVAQATAILQPAYVAQGGANGHPYLNCAVADTYNVLAFATNALSSLTAGEIFVVASNAAQPQAIGLGTLYEISGVSPDDNGASYVALSANNGIYEGFGSVPRHDNIAIISDSRLAAGAPYIWNVAAQTATAPDGYRVALNGTVLFTGANTFQILATNTLLGVTAAHFFKGRFYECVIFSRVLSSTERTLVTNYLQSRYRI